MFSKKTKLSVLFLLFSISLFSQIKIEGEMRLGDSTQVHILNTKSGDRLVGRVVGFDDQNIQFLMLGNRLTFAISEVEKVTVQTSDTPQAAVERDPDEAPFIYKIITPNGGEYEGEFLGFRYKDLIFELTDGNRRTFKQMEIKHLWLLGDNMYMQDKLPSQYHQFKLKNGEEIEGQLVSLESGKWGVATEKDKVDFYSKNEIEKIDLMVVDKNFGWHKSYLGNYKSKCK